MNLQPSGFPASPRSSEARARTRTIFLVNPASGNGATGKRWPALERQAADFGLDPHVEMSTGPGGLAEAARNAAERGAGLVVAVGGDGTVHEVANGLLSSERRPLPDLGILARGTGDDFVRALGIPAAEIDALTVLRDGRRRELDVGRVSYRTADGAEAQSYFVSMAGVGMSGAVAQRLNTMSKRLGGKVAGLVATFAVFSRWRNVELRVTVGDERREGRMEDVLVGNTEYHNGGMRLCPGAQPDDGFFDVLLIGDVTKRDLVRVLPKLYKGTYLPHPKAELLRGATVTVESSAPLPIELDGEQPGTTPVRFEVVPRALRLRVPA
jgi:YegS/Rv2252/BmrU family lipid kinase